MKHRNLINVISNWVNILVGASTAFYLSPLLITHLGEQSYGIWVLLVSITSFVALLDFGLNSSIVRYISSGDPSLQDKAANLLATTLTLFITVISTFTLLSLVFSDSVEKLLDSIFKIPNFALVAFIILLFEAFINIISGALWGVIIGRQKYYVFSNVNWIFTLFRLATFTTLIKLQESELVNFASTLLFIAFMKLALSIFFACKESIFKQLTSIFDSATLKAACSYSAFIFFIAICSKITYYSDPFIINHFLGPSEVGYFSIPVTFLQYIEQLSWALVGVMVPLISSSFTGSNVSTYRNTYLKGMRYLTLFFSPVFIVLFILGDDFIALWINQNFADKNALILPILLVGMICYVTQLPSHAVLKGISKHKWLSVLIIGEVLFNLVISIVLASQYGLIGVALGTAVPMTINNFICIPIITCKILNIPFGIYIKNLIITFSIPSFVLVSAYFLDIHSSTFSSFLLLASIIAISTYSVTLLFIRIYDRAILRKIIS